jgi:hypothetical protein
MWTYSKNVGGDLLNTFIPSYRGQEQQLLKLRTVSISVCWETRNEQRKEAVNNSSRTNLTISLSLKDQKNFELINEEH